jgi:hypothetical protein
MYAPAIGRASLTERTVLAGREVFLGRRRGPLAMLPFVGPAVIASIAYMDPGNLPVFGAWSNSSSLSLRTSGPASWMMRSAPLCRKCAGAGCRAQLLMKSQKVGVELLLMDVGRRRRASPVGR